ncbi:MAG: L-lactate permease, partial [Nitriliruptor sp.]
APLQAGAGLGIGVDPAILLTAQTVGGNVGNVFTPINVAVAAAAVGAVGHESEIIRSTVRDAVLLLLLAALMVLSLGLGFGR